MEKEEGAGREEEEEEEKGRRGWVVGQATWRSSSARKEKAGQRAPLPHPVFFLLLSPKGTARQAEPMLMLMSMLMSRATCGERFQGACSRQAGPPISPTPGSES